MKEPLPALAVFSGGAASRLNGADKSALLWKGKTLLQRIAAEFSFLPEKLLLNATGSALPLPFYAVADIYSGIGPMGALHAALSTTQSDTIFVLACDMPLVDRVLFSELFAVLTPDADAVVPRTARGIEPLCAIYRRSCLPAVEEMIKQECYSIRSIGGKVQMHYVDFTDETPFFNINTPEDVIKLKGLEARYE